MQVRLEICHYEAGEKALLYEHKEYFCKDHPAHAWQDSEMLQSNVEEIRRVRKLVVEFKNKNP